MKRALLFTGGAIGGLGAVVVLAPPDLTIVPPSVEPTVKPVAAETFTGDPITMRYGIVQVKITVQGGKIIDAQAVKVPTGSNDRYTQMSVPVLRERTIAAQSANIQAVSGASFTSYGWYTSLASAIAKAGL
jgi:uncharacterized protein with FMN-binding domain